MEPQNNQLPPQPVMLPTSPSPMPPQPFVSDGQAPRPSAVSTQLPKHRHKLLMPLYVTAAVLLVLGTLVAVGLSLLTVQTPAKVFQASLMNALSTRSFTQTSTQGNYKATMTFDVSDIRNPRIKSSLNLTDVGLTGNFEGYGDVQNTLINLKSDTTNSATANKWIQVRNNGALPANAESSLDLFYDPRAQFYGEYVLGNFTAAQRQSLVDYIISQHIYSYDSHKVTSASYDSQAVFVYPVTINVDKLKALNQKIAAITGFANEGSEDAPVDTSNLYSKLYISKISHRLLKADIEGEVTLAYGQFNTTKVPAKPKADLQWADYLKLTHNTSISSQLAQVQDKSKDTERQTDIRALQAQLEAYFAANNKYPSLAQLNDSTWISSNLPGLDLAVLKDPDGTGTSFAPAPLKHQYAYQVGANPTFTTTCDNSHTSCTAYKLTATLSTGEQFSKTSLN